MEAGGGGLRVWSFIASQPIKSSPCGHRLPKWPGADMIHGPSTPKEGRFVNAFGNQHVGTCIRHVYFLFQE